MEPLTALGFGAFFVVSLVVGLRLVLLWVQTRQLPELLIGVGVLGIGPVGFALAVTAQALAPSNGELARVFYACSQLAVSLGTFSKLVFNWRVYRPESRLARSGAAAGGLLLLAIYAQLAWSGFPISAPGLRHLPLVAALLWGSGEALAYRTRMRRRARIGLGDPVVENRFLVWGLGAGAAGLGSVVSMVAGSLGGAQVLVDPALLTVLSLFGLTAAVCMWLAFVPPRAYTRYLLSRSAEPAASHSPA